MEVNMKKEYKNTGYFVDESGNVYGKTCATLKPATSKKGYQTVRLSTKEGNKSMSVHRLVALLFIPNPKNLPEVNHIDGVKKNNTVENLEWVSTKENKKHAMEVLGYGFGETHSQATITTIQVTSICEMLQDGYRTIDISRETGVEVEKIRCIKKRRSWKHISKDYYFPKGKSDHGMSDTTFLWICHMLEEGVTSTNIIKAYTGGDNLSLQTIGNIRKRKTRAYLSKDFKF